MCLTIRNSTVTLVVTFMLSIMPVQVALSEPGLSAQTLKELAQVRRATARYHNIHNAIADGYVDANFVAPGIGCHMINFAYIFDPAIDLEKPELLVYADCSGTAGGRSELRAVEYSRLCVPEFDCGAVEMPEGFTGDHDAWEVFPGDPTAQPGPIPPQWTLHAWIWRNNPAGIFVKVNPSVD